MAGLLRAKTWATVYEQVRREKAGLFNALNLASLKVSRPSPLEAPIECGHLSSGEEFFEAWIAWYKGIDESVLPTADLQKKADKKGLSVPDAFAGLLVFDMLCLAATRYMFPENTFAKVAEVTRALPYTTLSQKHAAAAEYVAKLSLTRSVSNASNVSIAFDRLARLGASAQNCDGQNTVSQRCNGLAVKQ